MFTQIRTGFYDRYRMYVCTYPWLYVPLATPSIYIRTYTHSMLCTITYIRTYMYVCTYIHMYMYMYICTYIYSTVGFQKKFPYYLIATQCFLSTCTYNVRSYNPQCTPFLTPTVHTYIANTYLSVLPKSGQKVNSFSFPS